MTWCIRCVAPPSRDRAILAKAQIATWFWASGLNLVIGLSSLHDCRFTFMHLKVCPPQASPLQSPKKLKQDLVAWGSCTESLLWGAVGGGWIHFPRCLTRHPGHCSHCLDQGPDIGLTMSENHSFELNMHGLPFLSTTKNHVSKVGRTWNH